MSNSTPLIYLAKINRLQLLREFFKEVYIPNKVHEEATEINKVEKHPDALVIEGAIKQGWIKLHKTKIIKRLEEFGIDEGEAEAISLAIDLKCKEVLVDQSHARVAAKVFRLTPRGTIFVLLKALRKNIITFDDYLKDLGELIRVGFRMSDEVYVEAVKFGREIIKGK